MAHLLLEFSLPLLNNGDCNSKNLIYIILCLKCNIFYVGETNRTLKERFYDHLRKIKKFVPFKAKYYTEVSFHFNLKYHHIDDIKLCIFKTNLEDSILRKSAEDDLVNFLNIYKKRCINLKRSNNIKKLTFC